MFPINNAIKWEIESKRVFLENNQEIPNTLAIVRNDTLDVLNIVTTGEKYKLLTNRDFIKLVETIEEKTKLNILIFNEINGGEIIYSILQNENKRIIIYTSHNGTLATTLCQFSIINIENNIINLNVDSNKERIKHTLNGNFFDIILHLNRVEERFKKTNETLDKLKKIKIDNFEEICSNIFIKAKESRIINKINQCKEIFNKNKDLTGYGAVTSFCEYIDFHSKSHRNNDTKIKSIFFGGNSEKMKYEIFKNMKEML